MWLCSLTSSLRGHTHIRERLQALVSHRTPSVIGGGGLLSLTAFCSDTSHVPRGFVGRLIHSYGHFLFVHSVCQIIGLKVTNLWLYTIYIILKNIFQLSIRNVACPVSTYSVNMMTRWKVNQHFTTCVVWCHRQCVMQQTSHGGENEPGDDVC